MKCERHVVPDQRHTGEVGVAEMIDDWIQDILSRNKLVTMYCDCKITFPSSASKKSKIQETILEYAEMLGEIKV